MIMFDTEIWHITADTERRIYCGAIDNRVAVCPERGKEYGAFVKVPSDLFHFMQNVGGVTIEQLRDAPVSLFLCQEGDLWYFGLCSGEEGVDLWAYRSLPVWASRG